MVRHDEVGVVADEEPSADVDVELLELAYLLHEGDGIDNDAVADDAGDAGVKNAGRDEVKHVLLVADDDGVPRVRSSLVACDDIGALAQPIDDFFLFLRRPTGRRR